MTSISSVRFISPAVTTPGPVFSIVSLLIPEKSALKIIFLTFKTMSVTSSLTPFIDENSCKTPSILIPKTATPCSEDSKTLLNALPKVVP